MSRRHKTRLTKPPTSSRQTPSSEDEAGPVGHSPRIGRKEAEHKRRVVENQYYDELMTLLSMISDHSMLKKMDKVTTLKEAVICIKVYYDLVHSNTKTTPPILSEAPSKGTTSPTATSPPSPSLGAKDTPSGLHDRGEMLNFFLDAHDSFLMIVSDTGRILFTTSLVTSLLGQMQKRLVGQNIYDYVHAKHKSTIQSLFSWNGIEGKRLPDSPLLSYPSSSFSAHFKLYTGETNCERQYLPFTCLSFLREWAEASPTNHSSKTAPAKGVKGDDKKACAIIIGKLPTTMTLMDLAISTNEVNFEFDMRVSREGHIIDIDKHAVMVFGFSTAELIGTLFFEYVDPYHISDVGDSMAKFLHDGIGTTRPYRVRTKGGRSIWLISKGYLSYDPWNNKLNHILLANRVLGCEQVLPEHRFFENTKYLPVLDGKECYVPDFDAQPKQPATITSHHRTQSQTQSASYNCASTSDPARVDTNVFPHLSTSSSALPPLGEALNIAHRVFSNERRPRGGVEGGGGGGAQPTVTSSSGETQETSQEQLQRELEDKSLKLLEMQKNLMEQEQQFNLDRMQFFRAAQTMMQELSKGGRGGGQVQPPTSRNPIAILDSMNKSMENVPSPMGSMSSSMGPPSVSSRAGEHRTYPSWGEGGGMGQPRSCSGLTQRSDHISCINSPAPLGDTPTSQHLNHNFGSFGNSFSPNSAPMFSRASQMQPSPEEGGYHSPLSCLPYNCHPSLAEHNMQFYQQQQQQRQQQQQQQQQQQESMFGSSGGGLLQGNSGPSSGNPTRDYSHLLNSSSNGDVDLTDILNSTSSSFSS